MSKIQKRTERINEEIKTSEVRLVGGDFTNQVYSIKEALRMADEMKLDLVEISTNTFPPICKIADYSKLIYERKQKEKLQKQNNKKIKIKEIRLSYNIGTSDFNFKLIHASNFLKEGNKVKVYVMFSGREITFKEQGELILLKFVDAMNEIGKAEAMPRLDGKRLWVIVSPKK